MTLAVLCVTDELCFRAVEVASDASTCQTCNLAEVILS